jgi:tetratricopeptide (TPR) repeat protein
MMCILALISCCLLFIADETLAADEKAVTKEIYEKIQDAKALVDAKDYRGALQDLERLYDPDKLTKYEQATVLNYIGFVYYSMEDTAGAIRTYERMLAIPSLEEKMAQQVTYSLAQLYTMEKQYQKAIATLDNWFVMEADPAPDAFILKAQALYHLERHADMIEPIETAMSIASKRGQESKEDWYVLLNFAYYKEENYQKVREVQTTLLENWPKERYVLSLVGAHVELRQSSEALKVIDEWLAGGAAPTPKVLVAKGNILYLLQRYDEMIPPLELAMDLASKQGEDLDARGLELLSLARSSALPEVCRTPPMEYSSSSKYGIKSVDYQWDRWRIIADGGTVSDRKEASEMSVQNVRDQIADSCAPESLRKHIGYLVDRGKGAAECFLEPNKTRELLELAIPSVRG